MNLLELRSEAWDYAREVTSEDANRLWPKAHMDRYINRIYRHIARETRCIKDALSSICHIDATPTTDHIYYDNPASWLYQQTVAPNNYQLDPKILDVEEVKWTTQQWRLTPVSVAKWQTNPWWEQVVGLPTEYALDYSTGYLTVNFRSTVADTLRLVVRRLPLANLEEDEDIPEFRESYHDYFLNGVLWQMFSKRDAETLDQAKANEFFVLFQKDLDEIKQEEAKLGARLRPNSSLDAFR